MKSLLPFSLLAVVVAFAMNNAQADTFYLQANQSGNWTDLNTWFDQPSGGGDNPSGDGPLNGHDFFSNGFRVRAGAGTFGDESTTLTLNSQWVLRAAPPTTSTIHNLILAGSDTARFSAGVGTASATVTNLTASANARFDSDGNTRTIEFNIGTITGSGNLSISGNTTVHLSISTGVNYTGNLMFAALSTAGIFDFSNGFTIGGGLIANNDGVNSSNRIILDQNITVGSLILNGNSFAPGTYTASQLLTMNSGAYADLFEGSNTSDGVASITVIPEPTAASLWLLGIAGFVAGRRTRKN
jgi:hypothetical protein